MNATRVKIPLLPAWGAGLACGVVLTLAVIMTLGVPNWARPAPQAATGRPAVAAPAIVDQVAGLRDQQAAEAVPAPQPAVVDQVAGLRDQQAAEVVVQNAAPVGAGQFLCNVDGATIGNACIPQLSATEPAPSDSPATSAPLMPRGNGGLK